MLPKRPLVDTIADLKLYVTDDSRAEAETLAFRLNNTLIVGEPGSGKTSLLYKIRGNANSRLPRENPGAILVDARLATNANQLVALITQEAAGVGWIALPDALPRADDPFAAVTQIRRLRTAPENALVLIDDPDPGQATALFGRLRDELWQLPVWFNVAVNPAVERAALTRPPADAFFDVRAELAPFTPEQQFDMLKRRSVPGTKEITTFKAPTQPRAVLTIHDPERSTGARSDPERQYAAISQAEEVAGRQGAMLVGEIWNRGPASASDKDLQRALGLSRPRLTQLLTALEDAGTLISFPEQSTGAMGRPRTLYDIPGYR